MALLTYSLTMDLSILVFGLIGLLYWITSKNYDHWRKKGIPYLQPKPFVGNFKELVLGKLCSGEMLAKLYFDSPGKPYVGIFAFHRPILLVREAEMIKSVLVKDFNHFRDRTFNPDDALDPLFAKNLFGLNGPKWRHLRVKLTPTFTSGKMKLMFEFVNECGKELVHLVERNLSGAVNNELEVRDILARYTTDVITSCGFGLQGHAMTDPNSEFRRVFRKVVEWDFWMGIKTALAFFAPKILSKFRLRIWDREITEFSRKVVWETVEHRKKNNVVRKDFLDLLMQIRDKGRISEDGQLSNGHAKNGVANGHAKNGVANGNAKTNSEGDVTDYDFEGDEFVAQAFVFVAAGFETSSSTQSFALHELACNPDKQTLLREEIRSTLRAHGGKLTYEAIQNMPYLHQVIQETLRLYPSVPFLDRQCVEEYKLPDSNVVLEKGTSVIIPIFGIQRDPEIWDEPTAFRPERFDETKNQVPPFAHLPFGEGPRICIGMRMGFMQAKVGLAHFLNNYEVKPSEKTLIPLQLDPRSFTLANKTGIHLSVTKLSDPVR